MPSVMDLPTLISRTCAFPILGALGGDPDQMPHSVTSVLGLHHFTMSHKRDTRLVVC